MGMTDKEKGDRGRAGTAGDLDQGEALRQRILEKAYDLYVGRGRVHGHDLEDWLEAERLILRAPRSRTMERPTASGSKGQGARIGPDRRPSLER